MQWNRGAAENQAKLEAELAAVKSELERTRLERDRLEADWVEAKDAAEIAREAREDVRRVLEAARANEQRAEQEVQSLRAEASRLADQAGQTERARGALEGSLKSLETRLVAERQSADAALREAHASAWAMSAEHGENMQALSQEHARAEALLREARLQQPAQRRRVVARAAAAVALICFALAGLLLPGLIGMAAGDERARLLDGFTSLGARTPLVLFGVFATLGLGLVAWTVVLLRGSRVQRKADPKVLEKILAA